MKNISHRARHYALIEIAVHRDDAAFVEFSLSDFPPFPPHPFLHLGIRKDFDGTRGHGIDVSDGKQEATFTLGDDFRQAAGPSRDHRNLRCHGFQCCHAERFRFGRQQEQIARSNDLFEIRNIAEEENVIAQMPLAAEGLGARSVGTVADHHQPARNHARHALEDPEHVHDAFHRPEVRDVADQLLIGDSKQTASRCIAPESRWIDEVRNHFDRFPGAEVSGSFVAQPL